MQLAPLHHERRERRVHPDGAAAEGGVPGGEAAREPGQEDAAPEGGGVRAAHQREHRADLQPAESQHGGAVQVEVS
jgi:hypothetical protein